MIKKLFTAFPVIFLILNEALQVVSITRYTQLHKEGNFLVLIAESPKIFPEAAGIPHCSCSPQGQLLIGVSAPADKGNFLGRSIKVKIPAVIFVCDCISLEVSIIEILFSVADGNICIVLIAKFIQRQFKSFAIVGEYFGVDQEIQRAFVNRKSKDGTLGTEKAFSFSLDPEPNEFFQIRNIGKLIEKISVCPVSIAGTQGK